MTESVHHHVCNGVHFSLASTSGFPIDGARKAGYCVVHSFLAGSIDRLDFRFGDGLAGRRWRTVWIESVLLLKLTGLDLGGFFLFRLALNLFRRVAGARYACNKQECGYDSQYPSNGRAAGGSPMVPDKRPEPVRVALPEAAASPPTCPTPPAPVPGARRRPGADPRGPWWPGAAGRKPANPEARGRGAARSGRRRARRPASARRGSGPPGCGRRSPRSPTCPACRTRTAGRGRARRPAAGRARSPSTRTGRRRHRGCDGRGARRA